MTYKFAVGDRVVYTNDFGVCWGVKTVTELDTRGHGPTYHYEGSDTPWFSVDEKNFAPANKSDIFAHDHGYDWYFQKYEWTPTLEQMGGCY